MKFIKSFICNNFPKIYFELSIFLILIVYKEGESQVWRRVYIEYNMLGGSSLLP